MMAEVRAPAELNYLATALPSEGFLIIVAECEHDHGPKHEHEENPV